MEEFDKKLSKLIKRVDEFEKRKERTGEEERLKNIKKSIKEMGFVQDKIKSLEEKLNRSVEKKIGVVKEDVDTIREDIEKKLDELNEGINQFLDEKDVFVKSGELKDVSKRVGKLEEAAEAISDMKHRLNLLRDDVKKDLDEREFLFEKKLEKFREKLSSQGKLLAGLERLKETEKREKKRELEKVFSEIEPLKVSVSEIRNSLKDSKSFFERELESHRKDIADILESGELVKKGELDRLTAELEDVKDVKNGLKTLQNRVSDIAAELNSSREELEKTMELNARELDKISKETVKKDDIGGLKVSVDNNSNRLQTLLKDFGGLEKRIGEVEAGSKALEDIRKTADALKSEVEGLKVKGIGELAKRCELVEKDISAQKALIESLKSERISRKEFDGVAASLRGDVDKLGLKIGELEGVEKKVEGLEIALEKQGVKLEDFIKSDAAGKEDIETQLKKLSKLSEEVVGLKTEFEDFRKEAEKIRELEGSKREELIKSELKGIQEKFSSLLGEVESRLEEQDGIISQAVSGSKTALKESVEELSSRIDGLKGEFEALSATVREKSGHVSLIEERIKGIESKLDEHMAAIERMRSAADSFVKKDDIRSILADLEELENSVEGLKALKTDVKQWLDEQAEAVGDKWAEGFVKKEEIEGLKSGLTDVERLREELIGLRASFENHRDSVNRHIEEEKEFERFEIEEREKVVKKEELAEVKNQLESVRDDVFTAGKLAEELDRVKESTAVLLDRIENIDKRGRKMETRMKDIDAYLTERGPAEEADKLMKIQSDRLAQTENKLAVISNRIDVVMGKLSAMEKRQNTVVDEMKKRFEDDLKLIEEKAKKLEEEKVDLNELIDKMGISEDVESALDGIKEIKEKLHTLEDKKADADKISQLRKSVEEISRKNAQIIEMLLEKIS
jgi:DNA repair exonuclease SbcCD ATPase subunit